MMKTIGEGLTIEVLLKQLIQLSAGVLGADKIPNGLISVGSRDRLILYTTMLEGNHRERISRALSGL